MPKIQLPPNIKKLKDQLESGHNLVDHFLVCGVHPSTCINNFLYEERKLKYEEKLNELLKPCIISRFPEFDNSIDSVDDEIINYCFPEGFHPIISIGNKLDKKFFSVILDNNLFSAEYPQKYLSCLLFYENLSVYSNLKASIKEKGIKEILDVDDIEEVEEMAINSGDISTGDIQTGDTPKGDNTKIEETPCENNENEKENIIIDENLNHLKTQLSSKIIINKNSIRMNNNETQDINLATSLNFEVIKGGQFLKRSSFISEKKNVLIPKCICLVSIHPYINTFREILEKILDYILSTKEKDIPIEKIITNLIIETPIPPRGLYTINYNLFNVEKQFIGCENNKVQVTEINLKNFNSSLDFQIKLEAIKHIILCSKILLFSKDLNKLCETILSFLILLFPFKYPFQVTSYLHKDNYNILESISPYFIGINDKYSDSFFDENEICIDGMNIFIIDLDKKKSYIKSDETFPNFPSRLTSTLEKDIKNLDYKYKKENDEKKYEYNSQYQDIFFEFFCELLKGYEDCLNMDYFKLSDEEKSTSIDTLFQCSKYVKNHSDSEFYKLFSEESQLFADFIYKRMIPRNNQEIIDVLLVNETNIKIKNKQKYFGSKENTDFLDSKEYEPINKYVVPLPRELSDIEKEAILEKKNKLLSYGQLISTSSDNTNQKTKISFSYVMFPELDFQLYCNNDNANDYLPPPDYSEEIEAINSDLLSKSSIGQNINLSIEMKNNLYLTWLEVWAYTFWYVDPVERKFRFDQMLDVLGQIVHHEMNIINLIFEILNQQNEHLMVVKLYQKILQLKINPSTFIYKIVSDRLDSKEMKDLFDEMKSGTNQKPLEFGKKEHKQLERTFLCKSEKSSLINKKITFDSEFSCVECTEPEPMNLLKICKTFEGIKNDILWAPCKNGHFNLPKIRVSFGLELFPKSGNSQIKTSDVSEVVLHSPYYLKSNIKNAVSTHYGINLKVDEFKANFSPLFWNFVWYCQIHGLDYTILLPYLKNLEKNRALNVFNPNDSNIKLQLDNALFKKNEELISEADHNVGQESTNSILIVKANFKNLQIEKKVSIEIQKIGKLKNKKTLTKFIDHLIKKSMSVCEIKEVPSISQTEIEVVNSDIRGSAIIPKSTSANE